MSDQIPNPPISPLKVLLPVGLGTALSLMGDATLYTVLPTNFAEAGIALAGVGIVLGINRAVRIFLNGPAGLLYDRSPRRPLFILALLIGTISTAVYAATRGLWPLLVGRILWGVSWSGIWVGGTSIILDVARPEERGRLIGIYQTWFFLGTALGALAGGVLTDLIGFNSTMWVGAAVCGLGTLAVWGMLPETRSSRPAAVLHEQKPRLSLRTNGGLWLTAILYGVNRFVIAGVLSATLGLLVERQMGSYRLVLGVASLTGILMAGRTLLSMITAVFTGTASDWLGDRWRLTAWVLGLGAVSMALLVWDGSIAILAGIALGAAASGGLQTLTSALPGDLVAQQQRSTAIGLVHTVGDLGSALGPPIAYALLPWINLSGLYLMCGLLFASQIIPVLRYQNQTRLAMSEVQ